MLQHGMVVVYLQYTSNDGSHPRVVGEVSSCRKGRAGGGQRSSPAARVFPAAAVGNANFVLLSYVRCTLLTVHRPTPGPSSHSSFGTSYVYDVGACAIVYCGLQELMSVDSVENPDRDRVLWSARRRLTCFRQSARARQWTDSGQRTWDMGHGAWERSRAGRCGS